MSKVSDDWLTNEESAKATAGFRRMCTVLSRNVQRAPNVVEKAIEDTFESSRSGVLL